jgi:hypothetical protein
VTLETRIERLEARLGGAHGWPVFDPEQWKADAEAALASGDILQFLENRERQELERCATDDQRANVCQWHEKARRQLANIEELEEPQE